jgi:hypothetical protein
MLNLLFFSSRKISGFFGGVFKAGIHVCLIMIVPFLTLPAYSSSNRLYQLSLSSGDVPDMYGDVLLNPAYGMYVKTFSVFFTPLIAWDYYNGNYDDLVEIDQEGNLSTGLAGVDVYLPVTSAFGFSASIIPQYSFYYDEINDNNDIFQWKGSLGTSWHSLPWLSLGAEFIYSSRDYQGLDNGKYVPLAENDVFSVKPGFLFILPSGWEISYAGLFQLNPQVITQAPDNYSYSHWRWYNSGGLYAGSIHVQKLNVRKRINEENLIGLNVSATVYEGDQQLEAYIDASATWQFTIPHGLFFLKIVYSAPPIPNVYTFGHWIHSLAGVEFELQDFLTLRVSSSFVNISVDPNFIVPVLPGISMWLEGGIHVRLSPLISLDLAVNDVQLDFRRASYSGGGFQFQLNYQKL